MRMNEIKIVKQLDRGLAYAEACFETFRVMNGHVFQQAEHQYRLQKGLQSYALKCTDDELQGWFEQAIAAAVKQGDDILLRMTVSAGMTDWGLCIQQCQPYVQIQMMPFQDRQALHLQSVLWPFPLREKQVKYTADYAESLRAIQQWKLDDPMQALILSDDNHVLSTLTANIAIYRQNKWFTPHGLGILDGIVRRFLVHQGMLIESRCPDVWLEDCEAIICMNSGVFLQPVDSINDRVLDTSHAAISSLKDAFQGLLGVPNMGGDGA